LLERLGENLSSRSFFAPVLSLNCVDREEKRRKAKKSQEKPRKAKKSEERSLHFAGRLLRRSEAEKQMRRPATVGMTGIAGGGKVDGVG
jgi:hypothetical protein